MTWRLVKSSFSRRTFTSCVCKLLTGNPRETASTGLWKGQANWWRHRDLITTVCMYWSWLVLRPALWGLVTSGGGGFTTCGAPWSGFTDMMATTNCVQGHTSSADSCYLPRVLELSFIRSSEGLREQQPASYIVFIPHRVTCGYIKKKKKGWNKAINKRSMSTTTAAVSNADSLQMCIRSGYKHSHCSFSNFLCVGG